VQAQARQAGGLLVRHRGHRRDGAHAHLRRAGFVQRLAAGDGGGGVAAGGGRGVAQGDHPGAVRVEPQRADVRGAGRRVPGERGRGQRRGGVRQGRAGGGGDEGRRAVGAGGRDVPHGEG